MRLLYNIPKLDSFLKNIYGRSSRGRLFIRVLAMPFERTFKKFRIYFSFLLDMYLQIHFRRAHLCVRISLCICIRPKVLTPYSRQTTFYFSRPRQKIHSSNDVGRRLVRYHFINANFANSSDQKLTSYMQKEGAMV